MMNNGGIGNTRRTGDTMTILHCIACHAPPVEPKGECGLIYLPGWNWIDLVIARLLASQEVFDRAAVAKGWWWFLNDNPERMLK
jgi:hypothetical protein